MKQQTNISFFFRGWKMFFILLIPALAALLYFGPFLNKKNSQLTIGFGGDTMLGRLTNETISKCGYAYPWGNVLSLLQKTDLNIINLETTLTTSTNKTPKVFNFKADPDKVETLIVGNIDVVSLANNHILDFGVEGLQETIETLDNAEIKHVGAGRNISQAKKPIIITKNGIAIGVIGYTDNEPGWLATQEKPGTNYIEVGDIETVKKDIAALRKKVDIVIVSIHWGPNKRQRPTQKFQNFAHQIIDAGADIIHGHSAHIFQGIEMYNNKLILYDTGDFVDDYAVDETLRNDQSFFYTVTLSKHNEKINISNVQLTPLLIDNIQVNKATEEEKNEIIKRIQKLSLELGTKVDSKGNLQWIK